MPDDIGRREANREDVRHGVLTDVMGFDGFQRDIKCEIIGNGVRRT